MTNRAARKKQVVDTDIPGMVAYGPCIKVGEFLLPSGLMAIGHDGHIAGRTGADHGIDRMIGIGVVNHMHLGATSGNRNSRDRRRKSRRPRSAFPEPP
jgi:hypothetical protein